MAETNIIYKTIELKVAASSLSKSLSFLIEIRDLLQYDEEDLQDDCLAVSIQYEIAETELASIVELCENMLSQPPAYESNPDEFQHNVMELQVLCERAGKMVKDARDMLEKLCSMSVELDVYHMSISGVTIRAKNAISDAEELLHLSMDLVRLGSEKGTQ